MMDSVNGFLRLENQIIFLYPIIDGEKISCHSSDIFLRTKLLEGIDRYVNIEGEFDYHNSVQVTDIEIYPNEEELPTLFDLRGVAPNATGNLSSEDFVRKNRNENWNSE